MEATDLLDDGVLDFIHDTRENELDELFQAAYEYEDQLNSSPPRARMHPAVPVLAYACTWR